MNGNKIENLYYEFNSVKELTANDFKNMKKLIGNNHGGFIMFYAPWCGHCKMFVELWNYLAIQFKYQWLISAVNCTNPINEPICEKYNIDRYPTIYQIDSNGNLTKYIGSTDKNELIKYIYNQLL